MSAREDGLPIGSLFAGRFRIEALLGRGGMGVVYLVTHEVLKRPSALKLLRPALLAEPKSIARFQREAQAMCLIQHPHVTQVFDFGYSDEGLPYLALELVKGPTLTEVLQGAGALPVERALSILTQTAQALVAAHEASVVHRDLKPNNIVLREGGSHPDYVKVLDFGLAKILAPTGTPSLSTLRAFGTPHYIAPEEIRGDPTDYPADIYSFGVVAYELLTGQRPFRGSVRQVVQAHLRTKAPAPSGVAGNATIPPILDSIVLRCLAKEPSQRYPSAADLLEVLQEARTAVAQVGD